MNRPRRTGLDALLDRIEGDLLATSFAPIGVVHRRLVETD